MRCSTPELQRRSILLRTAFIGFLLAVGLLALSPRDVHAAFDASEDGFYRISLKENTGSLKLRQLAIENLITETDRDFVYVELRGSPESTSIRILPSIPVTYTLILPNNGNSAFRITDINGSPVSFPQESGGEVRYDISNPSIRIASGPTHIPSVQTLALTKTQSQIDLAPYRLTLSAPVSATEALTVRERSDIPVPKSGSLTSPVIEYDFDRESLGVPVTIKISYTDDGSDKRRRIAYYDRTQASWVSLPSYHHVEDSWVSAELPFSFAQVALMSDDQAQDGIASWYAYKGCLCAASRIYPKGSRVRVTRLKTYESVIVTINDYGPEEWTGRTIDLDKLAFQKIGSLGAGLIYVSVEPYD